MPLVQYRPLSRIIPHLCGLPRAVREKRILAVYEFRAFIDDSGNSPAEPWFVLAGWVGTVQVWENFTEDWADTLKRPRAIDYFKHNEALGRKGCFKGFSGEEIDDKAAALVGVIRRHNIYGVAVALKHEDYQNVFQAQMPRARRNKLHSYFKHPLYLCFNDILPTVFQLHHEKGFEGKIDFVFDAGKSRPDKTTVNCIAIYESVKEATRQQNGDYYPLMGTVTPGDDEQILPLQAADFLAGQIRMSKMHNDFLPPPLRDLARNNIVYHEMTADHLQRFLVEPFLQLVATHGTKRLPDESKADNE